MLEKQRGAQKNPSIKASLCRVGDEAGPITAERRLFYTGESLRGMIK
jgi:hypothetical protein